jgi:hypothetical protein
MTRTRPKAEVFIAGEDWGLRLPVSHRADNEPMSGQEKNRHPSPNELELELIQTQMGQKPVLREEVYARALRASHNAKAA